MEENVLAEIKEEEVETVEKTAVEALGELMRFPFQDLEWRKKFTIGSLLFIASFIIPFVPMLAMGGYVLKVMRQAVMGQSPSLPEWDDWGELILEGLKGAGIIFIYLIPGYILLIGGYLFLFVGQFLAILPSAAAGSSGDPDAVAAGFLATLGVTFGSIILQFVLMGLGFLLLFAGLLPLPLALGNYLYEGEFGAAFRMKEIWAYFKLNKSGFLAAWVIYLGLAYLMTLPTLIFYFTIVLICLMPIVIAPFTFYIYLTGAVGFGQYYRETRMIWEEKTAV